MYIVRTVFIIVLTLSWSASLSQTKKSGKKENNKENTSQNKEVKEDLVSKIEAVTNPKVDVPLEMSITAYEIEEALQNPNLVTKLILKKKGLTSIPTEISQLSNLIELDLSDNEISEGTSSLKSVKTLEILNISGNKLKSIPSEICGLSNLISLNLSNNAISSGSVACASKLERLYLSNNKLSSFPDGIFQLSELKSIFIQGNQLTTIPDNINSLKNLQMLVIHLNKIAEEPNNIKLGKAINVLFYPQALSSSKNYFYVKDESDLRSVNTNLNTRIQSSPGSDDKSGNNAAAFEGDKLEDADYNIRSFPIENGYRLLRIGDHKYKKYSFLRLYFNALGYYTGISEIHWLISKRHRNNLKLTQLDNYQKAIIKYSMKRPNIFTKRRAKTLNRRSVSIYRRYLRSNGIKAN